MAKLRANEKYSVKLTLWESFLSTFKALVGIGILSCPYAYKEVGLIGGILGNVIIILVFNFIYSQLTEILESQEDESDTRTLSGLALKILGVKSKAVVDFCILCSQLAVCTAYLKYFGA